MLRVSYQHTVSVWSLDNNQLSYNMKSQLDAVRQYKTDGSNGYQQVEGIAELGRWGMRIWT